MARANLPPVEVEQAPVTRAEVEQAAHRIAGRVRVTPIVELEPGAFSSAARISLKLELLQHTGSFKPRGAFNRLLSAGEIPPAGVVAASGGNAGLAVAFAARALGAAATIFVPEVASASKVARIRALGASVVVGGAHYADALAASARFARMNGALVVHAYDQRAVVAGQGTCALELASQADLDTVLVAAGGGGLIGGFAACYGGGVRLVAVEPESCPTLHAALGAGRPVDVEVGGVAADSLGARRIGEHCFALRAFIDSAVLVSDENIAAAQRALWESVRVVAEPGGAAALAALLSGAYRPEAGERVGVVVCGGNTDPGSVGR